MTNTFVSVKVDPPVDDFLEHFGIRGMKWGIRKARVSSAGSATNIQSTSANQRVAAYTQGERQRRLDSGKARIDMFDGNTKRAILSLAGSQIAGTLLAGTAKLAVRRLPNPIVVKGANVALDLGYAALTYRNINEGFKVAQAASANKKR